MSDRSTLIYKYDGSFEGLMCCVFESYERNEVPDKIYGPDYFQLTFFPVKEIQTDEKKAQRVLSSIPKKMSSKTLFFVKRCFLTCLEQKEWYILMFLRLGYEHGAKILNMISNDIVNALFRAENNLANEAHLYTGFIRFSVINNILATQIDPKNFVLPILGKHFANRYPSEQFIIYDSTHGMALVYDTKAVHICPMEDFVIPAPDASELEYRKLWQMFYNTIAVPGRENPKCRMSHMPKRYWKYMTEFACHSNTKISQSPSIYQPTE